MTDTVSFKADFLRRASLPGVDPSDAYAIYALSIFVDEPDLSALTAEALTGGSADKKADFVYLEPESERAFIGQAYLANQWGKEEAKANKAAHLATAVTWLIGTPLNKVPADLRTRAADLRKAINDGTVTKLFLLYAHNCHESENVRQELETAALAARRLCGPSVKVTSKELGIETLDRLFALIDKDILIIDSVAFDVGYGYYEIKGPNWEAIATRIDGGVFHDLHKQYGDDLFSANIRSYLGVLKGKKGNINAEIRKTVQDAPEHFWAFNNGITILTNGYMLNDGRLTAEGVSIINGAQTTGVLGESTRSNAAKTIVPCRFIKSGDPDTIERIITYNNTQNAVKSFDLRSNDRVQRDLAKQFEEVGIAYVHRRSQSRRAPANSIHVESVAQGLASFHREFQTAIRQRSSIFDEDNLYDKVFPKHIGAGHVYLVQCLLDAIDTFKLDLRAKQKNKSLTGLQNEYLELLEFSTGKKFLVCVIGYVADQIMGTEVGDLHNWRVKEILPDRGGIIAAWSDVLLATVPRIARATKPDPQVAVRSTERAHKAGDALADHLESEGDSLSSRFRKIRRLTTTG